MEEENIIYAPTKEEKENMIKKCNEILKVMERMTMPQKAMTLQIVTESLYEHYRINKVEIR